jgi:hypothetical protein
MELYAHTNSIASRNCKLLMFVANCVAVMALFRSRETLYESPCCIYIYHTGILQYCDIIITYAVLKVDAMRNAHMYRVEDGSALVHKCAAAVMSSRLQRNKQLSR